MEKGDYVYIVNPPKNSDKFGGGERYEGIHEVDFVMADGRVVVGDYIFSSEGICLSDKSIRFYIPPQRYEIVIENGIKLRETTEWKKFINKIK